jgi:hypothetical protein
LFVRICSYTQAFTAVGPPPSICFFISIKSRENVSANGLKLIYEIEKGRSPSAHLEPDREKQVDGKAVSVYYIKSLEREDRNGEEEEENSNTNSEWN